MFRLSVVLCCVLAINAQLIREEAHPAPEPYSFAFSSPNDDGTSSSQEQTGDASGRVTGSYTIQGADGQSRRVEYVADENGFRANVITNEIGTESQNAADVQYQSSAPTAAELTAQWEASGAGRQRLAAVGPIGRPVLAQAPVFAAPRPAIRAPFAASQRGVGLVSSQINPIGGGFAGVQALRINQGVRIARPLPAPIAPIAPLPVAPIAQPIPISAPQQGPIAVSGLSRAQFGNGLIGVNQQPFGLRLSPLNFGQFNFGGQPLALNPAPIQHLDSLRGLQGTYQQGGIAFGSFPLNNNNGAQHSLFLLPNNVEQPQLIHSGSDATTNVITQKTDSEDYGRKSK